MNAPANISPALARYRDAVVAFLPKAAGEELDARCRLLMARDTATAALTRCSDAEAGLMQEIQRLGTLYAFAAVPVPALRRLLEAQRFMLRAAACLGQFADAVEGESARG